ncbi:MAG: hypothetical protein ACYC2P_09290 [Paludibacteraceae bacterium]
MRKVLIVLTIVFVALSVIFVILPMGSIALLPTGLAVLLSILAFLNSEKVQKKLPEWLGIISIALFVLALGKVIFIKDKVEVDQQFQQEQVQSSQDAQQELEGIEELDSI